MVLAQTEITVFEFIDMLKLICFYSIIFPSWRCFQLRSWVIIFGLHRFDLILVFHNLFLPGISRITDLALWPDVFIFIFLATCAEAMPKQCSSANNIRGYFSQLRKCYSTSVTELLTSFQLIYGKWAPPSVGPSPNTNWLLLLHLHLALWLPWVTKTEFFLTISIQY